MSFPICVTCGTQFDAGGSGVCPICEDPRQFVGWNGQQWTTLELCGGVTLVNCRGHFDGYQVLHWAAGKGVLLAGDQPQVAMDRSWVSFLYSYPNMIPLSGKAVRHIVAMLEPFAYDRIYGA